MCNFLLRLSWQLIRQLDSKCSVGQRYVGSLIYETQEILKLLMDSVLVVLLWLLLFCCSNGHEHQLTVACLVMEKPRHQGFARGTFLVCCAVRWGTGGVWG